MKKVLILSGSPRKGGNYATGVYQKGEIQNNSALAEAYEMGKKV